jgi:hypothetical protein
MDMDETYGMFDGVREMRITRIVPTGVGDGRVQLYGENSKYYVYATIKDGIKEGDNIKYISGGENFGYLVKERVFAWNAGDYSEKTGDPWIVGYFMPPGDIRHSNDLEIKYALHKKGEEGDWGKDMTSTVTILVRGKLRLWFKDDFGSKEREVLLQRQGDVVMWEVGGSHKWTAEEESFALTIRWPSIPKK